MRDGLIASFRIDISSVREHTWQGRVFSGERSYSFESELEMLRYMIELAPGLAPELCLGAAQPEEFDEVN